MGNRDTGFDPHSRARRKHRQPRLLSKLRILFLMFFITVVAIVWYMGTLYAIARAKRISLRGTTESWSHDISHMFVRRQSSARRTEGSDDSHTGDLENGTMDEGITQLLSMEHALYEDVRGLEEDMLHMNAGGGKHKSTEQEHQEGRKAGDGINRLTAGGTGEGRPGETAWKHPLRSPDEGLTCEAWLEQVDGMTGGRDFSKQPIRVRDGQDKAWPCDVACETSHSEPLDALMNRGDRERGVVRSMEAESYYPQLKPQTARTRYAVVMTPHYDSDVPVQYGSWAEYDIMHPWSIAEKNATALAAIFLSNCRANSFRKEAVDALLKFIPIHTYGRCYNNMPRVRNKLLQLRQYKFSLAFENSIEPDYLTEKFWQSLEAGAMPVVIGAPNIADFAPSRDSYLHITSMNDIPSVAHRMLQLAGNDSALSQAMSWKQEGPTNAFLANMDLSCVHSSCRLCIFLADRVRKREETAVVADGRDTRHCRCLKQSLGSTPTSAAAPNATSPSVLYHLFVRERGRFRFTSLFLPGHQLTISHLQAAVRRSFLSLHHQPVWANCRRPDWLRSKERVQRLRVYRVYPAGATMKEAMWGSAWFWRDEQVERFVTGNPCGKLEVIFV